MAEGDPELAHCPIQINTELVRKAQGLASAQLDVHVRVAGMIS